MNIQKAFSLSDKLIDKTDLNFEEVYYYLPPKFSKDLQNSVLYSSIWTLDSYYQKIRKAEIEVGFQNSVLIREILKNSRWHGGSKEDNPTFFSLFINPEKFVLGCWDGGDYFKREDIKKIWENKQELKEYHEADYHGIGHHYGYNYFKYRFDEIRVDNEQGVLYGIVNLKRFPEIS